jgi:hypothetical protein
MTRITVVMVGRYRAENARRCLKTLLTQSRMPDEIVMADDGGNGWAQAMQSPIPGTDVKFKYYPYRPQGGPVHAYTLAVNAAWHLVTGDYVFMCPTDILAPYHGIERSIEAQDGTHRVVHVVYGLSEAATAMLDDPAFEAKWLGTDFEIFKSLPGWGNWRGACPAENAHADGWWHHTMFTSNTHEGWEEFWPGKPFSDSDQYGNDELCLFEMEQAPNAAFKPEGMTVPRRSLTRVDLPVYHQWHYKAGVEERIARGEFSEAALRAMRTS